MNVWIIFEENNDCPIGPDGDEYFYEWQTVIKVVDSEAKAKEYCKGKLFHRFKEWKVE
jgi:hypothetical protein